MKGQDEKWLLDDIFLLDPGGGSMIYGPLGMCLLRRVACPVFISKTTTKSTV